jgi:hypothetical protein
MPLSVELNEKEIYNWISQTRESAREEGLVLFNTLYWYLEEYSCVLIPRNKPWFEAVFPMIRETWDTILKERVEGFEHRSPKKKEKKIANTIVTSDVSGNSYTIENLNMDRTFCLVKLG